MMNTVSKPYRGLPMEGPIARWYAANTRRDTRGYRTTAAQLAQRLGAGSAVLEVAPGPGYLAIELAKLGSFHITGVDISHSFVQIARDNARQANLDIDFRHGDAAHLPCAAESFELVFCRAAFKNFSDPLGAIDEMYRVLRPGGQASIFDLRKDAPLAAIDDEVRGMHLSAVNTWLTKWTFRLMLLRTAYTREALQSMVARSRFGHGEILPDGIGFELRLLKPA